MNMRNGLAALTAGFLLMSVSGGVSGQTPQTMANNPLEARKAMLAARAARLSQQAPSAPEIGVKPDGTGGGPGPVSYTFSVLYTFTGGADGGLSYSGVVLDPNGNLYGTTGAGGDLSVNNGYGDGGVFKLDPSGKLTVLHVFTGGADGGLPCCNAFNSTPVLDNAGNLYGATSGGGVAGGLWTETVLHSFDYTDGANVVDGLVIAPGPPSQGLVLYGTTPSGGALGQGTVFEVRLGR